MKNEKKVVELEDLLNQISSACDSWREALCDLGVLFGRLRQLDVSSLSEEAQDLVQIILRREPDSVLPEFVEDDISELENLLDDQSMDEAS